jgi:fructose-bisphosphate aldolase class II
LQQAVAAEERASILPEDLRRAGASAKSPVAKLDRCLHRHLPEKVMPVADYVTYCQMLERARAGRFAYPAINVTSLTTANAVLKGLADSKSDGIIQVSTGGGAFASGTAVKNMALGAISIAEHVHRVADRYPIHVALHTDHCQADKLDAFVMPLVEETERRRASGRPNLFNGHMFDGSALPLTQNLDIAVQLHERFRRDDLILEIEVGVVGGEEDGIRASAAAKLYTTPEDTLEVARRLSASPGPSYLLAATFGNVHGVYKPGHVKLKPSILKDCQDAVAQAYGDAARFYFVFHGGSGSDLRDIHEALDHGVVKMNVDTDMQYAFTRAIADHCFKHYDGVLKVDAEVGDKKAYDPRSYLALAEAAMAERVKLAATELRSAGKALASA